jgi:hypothetical protein
MTEETVITLGEDLATAETPPPLPAGLYPARVKNFTKEPNKAGDGFNLVNQMELFGTNQKDDAGRPYEGRVFTDWMPMPKPGDESDRWAQGQTAREGKLANIREFLGAIGYNFGKEGKLEFKKILGAKCKVELAPDKDLRGRPVNRIASYHKI